MLNFTVYNDYSFFFLLLLVLLMGAMVALIVGLVKKNKALIILGIVIIVVDVGIVSYFTVSRTSINKLNTSFGTFSKNTAMSSESGMYYQSFPVTCTEKVGGEPVITGLSVATDSVGTSLEVVGCNFAGFEGDKNAKIENSRGVIGTVHGDEGSTNKLLKLTLKSPICQEDNSYSGLPCKNWLTLTAGIYKIYATAWGKDSKGVNFLIK